MPDTWKNGEHVDHDPIVEARAAHLMGHQRRVARSAVAIQTGCRAACREQTAADVLEARKALLLFLSVRRLVYEKGPRHTGSAFAQAVDLQSFALYVYETPLRDTNTSAWNVVGAVQLSMHNMQDNMHPAALKSSLRARQMNSAPCAK